MAIPKKYHMQIKTNVLLFNLKAVQPLKLYMMASVRIMSIMQNATLMGVIVVDLMLT